MCVNFEDEIFLGGENVKLEKNSICLKKGKTVICRYSIGGKSGNYLDLG